jgi:CheY-like chemotaxis protein
MAPTILVVDDEKKLRDMLRVYLEQEGYRVVEAGNGREALYVAR